MPQLCGYINYDQIPPLVVNAGYYLSVSSARVSFCSFPNSLPAGARVRSASLRLFTYQTPPAGGAGGAVQGAINEQQTYIQFRIMLDPSAYGESGSFAGTDSEIITHPKLVVRYTLP